MGQSRSRRIVVADVRRGMDPIKLMAISGVLGGLAGFVIWMLTETFVFLPVFLTAGLVTGVAIADSRRER
jgi:hypothetical protein